MLKNKVSSVSLAFYLGLSIALTACSNSAEQGTVQNETVEEPTAVNSYIITSDVIDEKEQRSVEVELPIKPNAEELEIISKQIYAQKQKETIKTIIGYRATGQDPLGPYWTTIEYERKAKPMVVEVKPTLDYSKPPNPYLIKKSDKGQFLGSWMASLDSDYKITAYRNNGETLLQYVFSDGSVTDVKYDILSVDGDIKLTPKAKDAKGEYFIINKAGLLEFWNNEDNKYYVAPKTQDVERASLEPNTTQTAPVTKPVVQNKTSDELQTDGIQNTNVNLPAKNSQEITENE